ncbi:MAG: radical SAM protein [Sandaracinaceae bacterium]|nr:radical SAM protein [Sandaracinaceae bacterium]
MRPPVGAVPERPSELVRGPAAGPDASISYVVWEITLACDLGCRHCGSRAGKARPDELTTEQCLDVVGQLAELGVREVTLIGGEAYLRDDWDVIARAIADRGMRCGITTGGRGLDEDRVQRAVDAGGLDHLGVDRRPRAHARSAARRAGLVPRRHRLGEPDREDADAPRDEHADQPALDAGARRARRPAARDRQRGVAAAAHGAHGARRRSPGAPAPALRSPRALPSARVDQAREAHAARHPRLPGQQHRLLLALRGAAALRRRGRHTLGLVRRGHELPRHRGRRQGEGLPVAALGSLHRRAEPRAIGARDRGRHGRAHAHRPPGRARISGASARAATTPTSARPGAPGPRRC